MSITEHFKNSFLGKFWLKYEKKIILLASVILIAAISFEAGYLKGQKNKKESVIVSQIAAVEETNHPESQTKADNTATKNAATNTPAKISAIEEPTAQTAEPQKCAFVASKNSNKYHLPTCRYAQNMKPENKICFSSKEEAESRGFQGAKCCIK